MTTAIESCEEDVSRYGKALEGYVRDLEKCHDLLSQEDVRAALLAEAEHIVRQINMYEQWIATKLKMIESLSA